MEEHRRQTEAQLRREVNKWVHHVADLDLDEAVRTLELDRPVTWGVRLERVVGLIAPDQPPIGAFAPAERRLTARAPYQQAPLSYLNAGGRSWSLWAEADRLEWFEFSADRRYGGIEFWFRNVTVGTTALVTINVTAGTPGPGVTGNLEVRSSDAPPRIFPVTGFADHTLDLIVHPSKSFAVLVTLEAKSGMSYLAFRGVTFKTL